MVGAGVVVGVEVTGGEVAVGASELSRLLAEVAWGHCGALFVAVDAEVW